MNSFFFSSAGIIQVNRRYVSNLSFTDLAWLICSIAVISRGRHHCCQPARKGDIVSLDVMCSRPMKMTVSFWMIIMHIKISCNNNFLLMSRYSSFSILPSLKLALSGVFVFHASTLTHKDTHTCLWISLVNIETMLLSIHS